MNTEFLEQKAKIIFIVLVSFLILLLLVITYFVYFDKDKMDENNTLNDLKTEINNLKNNLKNNNNNNNKLGGVKDKEHAGKINYTNTEFNESNNNNSLLKNIEQSSDNNSGVLDNVKDETHDDYKGNQVFHVSNNIFTYHDAKAVCKAYDSEIASHKQVKEAYDKGAEWCSYGWSDGQMALFPTQKHTWEKLQEDPEQSGICGNWGVNGGYFENPNTLFGVNCYGIKPKPKDREKLKKLPASSAEREIMAKAGRFKGEKHDMTIFPFSKDLWSQK